MQNSKNKLHMIGNAHLDPVWLWQWQEGFHEAKATFRSALDRMNEYPDFIFTCAAACYYQWIEQNAPDMFAEIKARIEEGRWNIVGGWWIQPDCNIPSGESFARQSLVGQRYFNDKFGKMARTGYNVDSFGHNAMIPQILKLSGMDRYVYMRPGQHEKEMPSNVFQWQSPDGSSVNTFRIPIAYCTWGKELRERILQCAEQIPEELGEAMCFYGVGNHGGGPTVQNIENIHRLQSELDVTLQLSSPDAFFDVVDRMDVTLPVIKGELLHHASGCYSAHSGVKRLNRKAENALLAAEKWSTIAQRAVNLPYPQAAFQRGWQQVLFNQFHDILAGTSLYEAYEDANNQYGEAISLAHEGMNAAIQALSWSIDIPQKDGTRPLVVFNPNGFDVVAPIEIQSPHIDEDMVLMDFDGTIIPMQIATPSPAIGGRYTLLFLADVPALGYHTYTIASSDGYVRPKQTQKSELILENTFLRAEISNETGFLISFKVKNGNDLIETLDRPGAVPVVIEDFSDTWSHGVFSFRKDIGTFTLKRVQVVESGPVRSTIRVEYSYGASTIIQHYMLWEGKDQLDVKVFVNWQEQSKMLKLSFPVKAKCNETIAEIPFGTANRPVDGIEYPMHSWVDLSGDDENGVMGLSIINDCKYSYDALGNDLRLTVLRSPRYAHHNPYVPGDEEFPFMDQGIQRFTYALVPHVGDLKKSQLVRKGMLMNQGTFALFETYHKGCLPPKMSFAKLNSDSVMLSAAKEAEDGTGDLIVHVYETDGKPANAVLAITQPSISLPIELGAYQIKAIRIPRVGAAYEVDLLEYSLEN